MFQKYIACAVLAAGLTMAGVAGAEFYAGGALGASFNGGNSYNKAGVKSTFENSVFTSLAGGYELPLPLFDLRGELELVHNRPELKNHQTKKLDGLFMNAYGTIPLVPFIDPYVGMGIGRVRFDHSNAFAFQAMAGADYELTFAPMTVGAELRYLKANGKTGAKDAPSKYHANILMFKVRYLF